MTATLTGFPLGVTVVSAVLAAAPAAVHAVAARRTAGPVRAMFAVVSVLAAVYVVAYAVLVFAPVDGGDWSETMRGVSLVAWPLVWMPHAWVVARTPKRFGEAVAAEVLRRIEDGS